MDFNFYLNTSLPIIILLFSLISPKLIYQNNYQKTPLILKIFFVSLIVLSLFKTTSISDYPYTLYELSGQETEVISKFPLLSIFINLPFSNESKLIIISLIASLILSLSIYNYQKFYKFNLITFSILIYAVYSLMTFHYRQYLSFAFVVSYIVLIQIPSRKKLSKLLIIISATLSIMTHPIYILSIIFIPLFYLFIKSSFYGTFCRDLIIKFRKIKLLKLNRIICFLIIGPLLATTLILPLYQFILTKIFSSYAMYAVNWFDSGIENRSTIFSLISKILFFLPFFIQLNKKVFINKFDYKNDIEYRYSNINIYFSFLIIILIFVIQNSTGLYSIERTYSVIYPFLIFDPFINKPTETSKNKIFQKIFILFIISIIVYKSIMYISSYTPTDCYCL